MTTIALQDAQTDLPNLIKRVLDGEDVVIEAGTSKIRLTIIEAPPTCAAEANGRGFGMLKGQIEIGPEFFEPLSPEEAGLGDWPRDHT
jgi:antitoxin (DNA-binding transcriptional repressor) of toxin-antitoxin stability system